MYCFNQYSRLAIFQAKLGPLRDEKKSVQWTCKEYIKGLCSRFVRVSEFKMSRSRRNKCKYTIYN